MKQRLWFISNSSSSSFIIHKRNLSEEQLKIINIVYNLINAIDPGPESKAEFDYQYNTHYLALDNCCSIAGLKDFLANYKIEGEII